jgi:phospho-N-acetylmuramoyl-pentapeptide-transferase
MERIKYFIFILVFLLSIFLIKFLIFYLRNAGIVQFERDEGPDSHKIKEGTPRGGGLIFFLAPLFLLFFYKNSEFLFLYLALILNGFIGFIDDFLTATKRHSTGLTIKWKMILITVIALFLYIFGRNFLTYELSIGNSSFQIGRFFYFILFLIIFVGSSNAFNLTDGVDGLLGIVSIPMLVTIAIINKGIVRDFSFILIPSIIAFLWFNSPKASIFMGDTGAGALGGAIAAMSILGKFELLLPLIAIIPVLESLSVFIQVGYFKLSKGKRVFKMAPIHHHFELLNWSESEIDFRFFIITVMFCILALFFRGRM